VQAGAVETEGVCKELELQQQLSEAVAKALAMETSLKAQVVAEQSAKLVALEELSFLSSSFSSLQFEHQGLMKSTFDLDSDLLVLHDRCLLLQSELDHAQASLSVFKKSEKLSDSIEFSSLNNVENLERSLSEAYRRNNALDIELEGLRHDYSDLAATLEELQQERDSLHCHNLKINAVSLEYKNNLDLFSLQNDELFACLELLRAQHIDLKTNHIDIMEKISLPDENVFSSEKVLKRNLT